MGGPIARLMTHSPLVSGCLRHVHIQMEHASGIVVVDHKTTDRSEFYWTRQPYLN
jgi:hypothetical protein